MKAAKHRTGMNTVHPTLKDMLLLSCMGGILVIPCWSTAAPQAAESNDLGYTVTAPSAPSADPTGPSPQTDGSAGAAVGEPSNGGRDTTGESVDAPQGAEGETGTPVDGGEPNEPSQTPPLPVGPDMSLAEATGMPMAHGVSANPLDVLMDATLQNQTQGISPAVVDANDQTGRVVYEA